MEYGKGTDVKNKDKKSPHNQHEVRWFIRKDLDRVVTIDWMCFEHSWDEEDFLESQRQRNRVGMVVEIDREVVGYMIYELRKDHLALIRLGVHPDHRLSGVGRTLVNKLLSKIRSQQRNRIELNVRESNLSAQKFYFRLGFKAVKVERKYYSDTGEDSYLFCSYNNSEVTRNPGAANEQ